MELFYSGEITAGKIILGEEESHHCIKVMRHRTGEELNVTDGRGKLFRASIIDDNHKRCQLQIGELLKEEKAAVTQIHIAISPTKNADRFEWFLEKATEIGVNTITPLICKRTERDRIKFERLNNILISSMKQSLRFWLPQLNESKKMSDFVADVLENPVQDVQKFICHCQSDHLPQLNKSCHPNDHVVILIGPEGDFTPEEINLAERNGFIPVTLGDYRLRTETAGLIALHTIQLLNQ